MHFFDVTDIMFYVERHTTISGIQRVSFEVIKRMIERHGVQTVRLSYWDRKRREYLSVEAGFMAEMTEFDPDVWSAVFYGHRARSQVNTAPTLHRYRNHPLKYRLHALRRMYHALRGNEAHFKKHGSSIAEWRSFRPSTQPSPTSNLSNLERKRVLDVAQHGDHLVVLGATWSIDGSSYIMSMSVSSTIARNPRAPVPRRLAADAVCSSAPGVNSSSTLSILNST